MLGLLEILSWQASPWPERYCDDYVGQLQQALDYAFACLSWEDAALGGQLQQQFTQLSVSQQRAFLTDPNTYHHLAYLTGAEGADLVPYLQNALAAESGKDAQQLASIHLDYQSPGALGPLEGLCGPVVKFTEPELIAIQSALQQAIASLGPQPLHLLQLCTKVLVLRKDPLKQVRFGSYSTNQFIGRTVLFNPHLGGVADLANALVHEAIHDLLYMLEIQHPFVRSRAIEKFQVVSPWTGTSLAIHAYLHACLVWFGLWEFWRQTTAFPQAVQLGHRDRAVIGFQQGSLLAGLEPVAEHLDQALLDLIYKLQGCVST
jgi:hypothetical protein